MKRYCENETGQYVKILCDDEALNILRVMSRDTRIINFPNIIVELITSKFSIALKAIEYTTSIYFEYNIKLKNNKKEN